MEKDLNELVEKLKGAAGNNLKSVVLYGSAASGEFHPKHSDLNVLCVFERLGGAELEEMHAATEWWARKGQPPPLVFEREALLTSADVFPIEFLDIRSNRRVLFGEDVMAGLDVPMDLHRVELERELRTNLIRLRQSYLSGPRKAKRLVGLMAASFSTFVTLFRHALLALGEQPPRQNREVVARLAGLLGFDPTPFTALLEVRQGQRKEKHVDAETTFHGYLEGIMRVVNEVDRRLAARRAR